MHTHPTNYLPFSSQHRLFYAFDQTFDFKTWMDHRKNSYERRVYEWVIEFENQWVMYEEYNIYYVHIY